MDENKAMQNQNPDGAGEKTFTQEDVNKIVSDRLAREKAKGEAALAEKERQLAQRELQLTAKERLAQMGLPAELLDVLNLSSQEAMEKALTTVKTVFDTYKAAPPKFVGFQPGASNAKPDASGADAELRKAMRLS